MLSEDTISYCSSPNPRLEHISISKFNKLPPKETENKNTRKGTPEKNSGRETCLIPYLHTKPTPWLPIQKRYHISPTVTPSSLL